MDSESVSESERLILHTLFSEFRETNELATDFDVAKQIDERPDQVRNELSKLAERGLVVGTPGPKGGYSITFDGLTVLGPDVFSFQAIADNVTDITIQISEESIHNPFSEIKHDVVLTDEEASQLQSAVEAFVSNVASVNDFSFDPEMKSATANVLLSVLLQEFSQFSGSMEGDS